MTITDDNLVPTEKEKKDTISEFYGTKMISLAYEKRIFIFLALSYRPYDIISMYRVSISFYNIYTIVSGRDGKKGNDV